MAQYKLIYIGQINLHGSGIMGHRETLAGIKQDPQTVCLDQDAQSSLANKTYICRVLA
jgi:hypothetical protein